MLESKLYKIVKNVRIILKSNITKTLMQYLQFDYVFESI